MIIRHLLCHWRTYSPRDTWPTALLRAARCLRVLAFQRQHRALCRLALVREHVARAAPADVFHHLTYRGYLVRGLSPRRRAELALGHYRFDDATFDSAWQHAVYRAGGLRLWQHDANGWTFFIRLEMAVRRDAEGDLTLALVAGDKVLHRLSFSWVGGVPFIARNQGRWTDSDAAFAAFQAAFPHNAAGYFCFAALQGVAQELGMQHVLAVHSAAHIAWPACAAPLFVNAYDRFWTILGGAPFDAVSYRIPLPFYVKPLAAMPARHRKRAAQRRAYWQAIGTSAGAAIRRHLVRAPVTVAETADA